MNEELRGPSPARKVFSRIGWALSAVLVVATVLQLLWVFVPEWIWGEDNVLATSSWGMWVGSFLPMYAAAIPTGLWIMKALPAQAPERSKLGFGNFLVFLPICFFLMYSGNLIGTGLSSLLSGGTAENALLDYVMDNSLLKILVMVVMAPLMEEYLCRKQIIDRTRRFGEKTAVVFSAVAFGLLHQNLFQFFYAFALGLVFGYVYVRTGKLRYSVVYHAIVNFMGSVLAPWILSQVDMAALEAVDAGASAEELAQVYGAVLPGLVAFMGYVLFLLAMSVAGLVLLIAKRKKLVWQEAPEQLPRGTAAKTVCINWGMAVYVLICLAATVYALL